MAKTKTSIKDITVTLEPTSTYHLELIYWLHAQEAAICLANPKDTHHYAKSLDRDSKTDRLDSFAVLLDANVLKDYQSDMRFVLEMLVAYLKYCKQFLVLAKSSHHI